MKKLLLTTLLIGWFWGFRITHPNGASISIVVGPFPTEIRCEVSQKIGVEFFEGLLGEGTVVNCQEKQES